MKLCPARAELPRALPFPAARPSRPELIPRCYAASPSAAWPPSLLNCRRRTRQRWQPPDRPVNGAYIGNTLAAGANVNGINMFAPDYQTPRSVQMNIGLERQFGKGVVWNADYIRNIGTHTLLAVDVNHVGDVRFFNKTNAINAIAATNAAFGCGASASAVATNCAIAAGA